MEELHDKVTLPGVSADVCICMNVRMYVNMLCLCVCVCTYVCMYITEICSCGLHTCCQFYVCLPCNQCVCYAIRVFCIEYVHTYVHTRVLELCYERMYMFCFV